jgi:peroxiredoxin/uncharacterized membrane protein YphA (DoxX/SURF4 family)
MFDMDGVIVLGRLLLAAVFSLAGIAKLADRPGSVRSMLQFGLPPALARPFASVLPVAELICAILLVPATTSRWGAIGVLALLVLFIIAISVSLARGRTPDCHCFGQFHSAPIGWTTLVRNVILAGIAIVIIRHSGQNASPSIVDSMRDVARMQTLAVLISWIAAAVAVFAVYLVFHVLRQNGRLLVRLEAVEAKLGIVPSTSVPAGLPVDSPAPEFRLSDLDGGTVTLDILRKADKPLLLVFSEPGCGACDLLLPDVARWQREYADRLSTVVISRGTAGQNRNKRAKLDLRIVLLQLNREVAESYRIVATPSAVLVSHGRIARPTVTGADAIRGLVTDITALRVRKGDAPPSVTLVDLRGEPIDLSKVRGRRTVLLFWNPACGFCQKMLGRLKAWESHRRKDAPELLVVSSGSAEANNEQGFRSRVLLDENFTAGQMLGVTGTPSAVLLDEQGRVASEIAVGEELVMALARTGR